ncbi:MAG: helix-turn-helix domain-containing protein [Pseudonocardiaceae bacterium]
MTRPKRVLLVRARKAAGFTQEKLAYRLRVDRSTIGRWESGETEPLPGLQPKLADLLGVTRERLSELLAVETETDSYAAEVGGRLDVDERRHLAAALADARRYLDHSVVTYFRRQLDTCENDDGAYGPTKTLPVTLGILGAIGQCAREVRLDVLPQLLSVGARGAEFAGWLYRDVHNPERAEFWYSRATEWAQEAGDTAAQGYILLRKSQMAYEERDARRVLTLAQAAQYGPWQLPSHVRAEVTQQEARGLAMVGESMSIIERKLDDARLLVASTTPDNDLDNPSINEGTLTLRNASCYIEAGKPHQAAVLYKQVLSADLLSHRDRGYFLARMASSLALAGEPDDAATAGLEAVQIATATTSQRTKRELMRSLVALKPWHNRPGPRALREAVVDH